MKKVGCWTMIGSAVFAVLPIINILLTALIATVFDCEVNESGAQLCITPFGEIGNLLYLLGVSGWFIFFTLPLGLIGVVVGFVLFLLGKRQ